MPVHAIQIYVALIAPAQPRQPRAFCFRTYTFTAVAVAQDRIREKQFLQENGFETARFAVVEQRNALGEALKQVGMPALIKLSRSGYDGKEQRLVRNLGEAELAFDDLGGKPCVLEEWITIQTEVSVVIARRRYKRGRLPS